MKNILLGIIAINLIFVSANLALSSVGAVHAQDLNPLDAKTDPVIDEGEESGEAEDSGEAADLNDINSETSGDITLGGGVESGEAEDSGEAADLNDINSETTGTITATVGDGEEDPE